MTTPQNQTIQSVSQVLTLVVMIVGVGGLFLTVGRRDAILDQNSGEIAELKAIASDLVKTSIESTTTNREQDRRLDDLKIRLARLENKSE